MLLHRQFRVGVEVLVEAFERDEKIVGGRGQEANGRGHARLLQAGASVSTGAARTAASRSSQARSALAEAQRVPAGERVGVFDQGQQLQDADATRQPMVQAVGAMGTRHDHLQVGRSGIAG
jgi:hypothetical protein